jgi:hypothetical protein
MIYLHFVTQFIFTIEVRIPVPNQEMIIHQHIGD